ncbi:MAG: hypothetical protein ACHQ5A_12920, partial [Opitutales bacterium]
MPSEPNRPRPQEQEAIRTTIVGGRPPGCGKAVGGVPRGIEVLVKKAAVDPEFRSLLLSERGQAARSIGLELSAAESMMLSAVPAAQLRSIIAATTVPPSHMPAFLGKVAAVMLAALGIVQAGCDDNKGKPAGIRPEDQPKDNPAAANRPAEPADAQPPLTVAGVVSVKPLTRPATQPTEPVMPVAGVRPIFGERIDRPAEPADVAGIRAERPENVTVFGILPDKPRPAIQPTTKPSADQPSEITVLGARINRPQDTVIRGLRADTPQVPPTTPADDQPRRIAGVMADKPQTRPTTQPTEPVGPAAGERPGYIEPPVFGLMVDRPQNPAIRDIRADDPPVAMAGVMADKPPTRPTTPEVTLRFPGVSADSPAPLAHGMAGIMADPVTIRFPGGHADNPAPIAGERIDRPPEPVAVAGLRAIRPEDVKIAGLTADAPTRPTTQPTTQP